MGGDVCYVCGEQRLTVIQREREPQRKTEKTSNSWKKNSNGQ
jgi:hypothetical protein